MTLCLGIRVQEGLVALADTQIVRGSERASKAKLSVHHYFERPIFIMTSGLRSVRDKAVIYLEEMLEEHEEPQSHLHEIATLLGKAIRRVRAEDGEALEMSKLSFNMHALIGGQLARDEHPVLLNIYPEGNWIEAESDIPYFMIGRTTYGRPILDRLLSYNGSLDHALALAYLAFDATRTSVTDVDFPIDIACLRPGENVLVKHRFFQEEMGEVARWWQERLGKALVEFPMDWARILTQRSVG